MTILRACHALLLVSATPALAFPVQSEAGGADVFIGTLERGASGLILRRCDLAQNRYALVDAPGAHALATLRKARLPAYGEVIGRYTEQGDRSILMVERIEKLKPGKNCHLADALGG